MVRKRRESNVAGTTNQTENTNGNMRNEHLNNTVEELTRLTRNIEKNISEMAEPMTEEPNLAIAEQSFVPELNKAERIEVARRSSPRPLIVLEAVREEGEQELRRSSPALAISGLAAGLSMGFSLVAQGLLHATLAVPFWGPFIENFGYSLGFLIVVLGRQQLFTENTLTVILPFLAHPNWSTIWHIIRLWAVVLVANLLGALIFATVIAHTAVFQPHIQLAFKEVAMLSLRGDFVTTILRGIFAGWLIALMVWLLPSADGSRLSIIILITYIVALGGFAHIIAGSVDVLYLVNIGAVSWYTFFIGFMLPTLIGNIIGGVLLVAMLNFGQVVAEKLPGGKK